MRDIGKGPWKSGPPPSVGWWPASAIRDKNYLRWWNGKRWSVGVASGITATFAGLRAMVPADGIEVPDIEWRDRADWWPERSRT